jgi:2-polyprenyl-3-methyl-5-hydroxy-6-metoxy-1,4-benzoquinol methylase
MATHISAVRGQFYYFDHQLDHPDWTGKRVLDFGGNVGNILLDPGCQIEPADYWSIDVVQESIDQGQARHPEAHFVFFDRYNRAFNPTGTVGLPIPDQGIQFDFILGLSVFTHVSKAETVEYADRLLGFLTDDGKAAFTFIDPWWTPPPGHADEFADAGGHSSSACNLQWRLERHSRYKPEMDVAGLLERAEASTLTWATLVNHDELHLDPDDDGMAEDTRSPNYDTFCTTDYMRELFPGGQIVEPVAPVRQHCLILRKQS